MTSENSCQTGTVTHSAKTGWLGIARKLDILCQKAANTAVKGLAERIMIKWEMSWGNPRVHTATQKSQSDSGRQALGLPRHCQNPMMHTFVRRRPPGTRQRRLRPSMMLRGGTPHLLPVKPAALQPSSPCTAHILQ